MAPLKNALANMNVDLVVVAEALANGVDQTYSASDASQFDAIIVGDGTDALFTNPAPSTLYPVGRPAQILQDGYRWGKPVGTVASSSPALQAAGIQAGTPGVYNAVNAADLAEGLKTFKFLDRFPVDQ
jgi:catalase